MKLLLTSGGITNESIAAELRGLVGKPASEATVAFVPTAAFVEAGDKSWFVAQFTDLQKFGFGRIDIVEPSLPHTDWQERLTDSDIIFVSGGNTYFLLDQARKSGFASWVQKELGERVYVGSSAGSILATPTIATAANGDQNIVGLQDVRGMDLVDFEILPHVPAEISMDVAEDYAKTALHRLYALDDQSAIVVGDGNERIVGEGSGRVFPAAS